MSNCRCKNKSCSINFGWHSKLGWQATPNKANKKAPKPDEKNLIPLGIVIPDKEHLMLYGAPPTAADFESADYNDHEDYESVLFKLTVKDCPAKSLKIVMTAAPKGSDKKNDGKVVLNNSLAFFNESLNELCLVDSSAAESKPKTAEDDSKSVESYFPEGDYYLRWNGVLNLDGCTATRDLPADELVKNVLHTGFLKSHDLKLTLTVIFCDGKSAEAKKTISFSPIKKDSAWLDSIVFFNGRNGASGPEVLLKMRPRVLDENCGDNNLNRTYDQLKQLAKAGLEIHWRRHDNNMALNNAARNTILEDLSMYYIPGKATADTIGPGGGEPKEAADLGIILNNKHNNKYPTLIKVSSSATIHDKDNPATNKFLPDSDCDFDLEIINPAVDDRRSCCAMLWKRVLYNDVKITGPDTKPDPFDYYKSDLDFMETFAHEYGHIILNDVYGTTGYSWIHKQSSTLGQDVDTKNSIKLPKIPPASEVDLMLYYIDHKVKEPTGESFAYLDLQHRIYSKACNDDVRSAIFLTGLTASFK